MPLVAWSPITQASRATARAALVEVKVQALGRKPRTANPAKTTLVDAFLPFVFDCQRARALAPGNSHDAPEREVPVESGGADRNRTDDIQLAKLALYHLSYSPNQARVSEGGGPRWI
jgi:hypothetical protein